MKKWGTRAVAGAIVTGLGGIMGTGVWNSDPVIMWRINRSGFDASKYSMHDYLDAIVQIESKGNPHAQRYEPHMNDTSYGLGQILTKTARELEGRHPELPRLGDTIESRLCDPRVNLAYTEALFADRIAQYTDPLLAVAAYNAGWNTPLVVACQEMFNDLENAGLDRDGINGPETKKYVMPFQREQGLAEDGRIGPKTWGALARVYEKETGKKAPRAAIPRNGMTPHHVLKFIKALEDDVRVTDQYINK